MFNASETCIQVRNNPMQKLSVSDYINSETYNS